MSETQLDRILREILDYRCPRYDQLPDLPLYSEQLIDILTRLTVPLLGDGREPVLTPSMINNYVKQKLIPPPEKKRYDRTHLAYLYCICLLKQVFSIQEISSIFHIQTDRSSFPAA